LGTRLNQFSRYFAALRLALFFAGLAAFVGFAAAVLLDDFFPPLANAWSQPLA